MDRSVPLWSPNKDMRGWHYVEVPPENIFKPEVGWVYNDDAYEFLSNIEFEGRDWQLSSTFVKSINNDDVSVVGFQDANDAFLFKLRFG